jgi:hypothetical protein
MKLITILVLLFSAPALAQRRADSAKDKDKAAQEALSGSEFDLSMDPPTEAKADAWIVQLGAPCYTDRAVATEGLIDIGAPAMARLRAAYHRADDLETKLRIEGIVRTAYLNHHVLDKHGFLGISMRPFQPGVTDARIPKGKIPELPEGRVGILIATVIPETGASNAGVKQWDVIIALNGQPVRGANRAISESFSAIVRALRPGAIVELTIVRGKETITINATLGRPPESVARANNIIVVSEEYQRFKAFFEPWWYKYFRAQPHAVVAAEQDAP